MIKRFALLGILAGAGPAAVAQVDIGFGLRVPVAGQSLQRLRDANVVRQQFDYSCGAAALATILRYGYGDDVSEPQLLSDLFDQLTPDEREEAERTGFSLFNLQQVAEARGYRAAGFRLLPDQLALLGGPVIVYIEPRGYRHFAVLRGVVGDRAYLADPSRGNVRMPLYRFLDSWLQDDGMGIIFAVEPANRTPVIDALLDVRGGDTRRPEVISVRDALAIGRPGRNVQGRVPGP